MSWCAPSRRQFKYDVFLSFRGLDTRKNIISHLHKELVRQGIRTFKDDVTLVTGDRFPDRLREAIITSRFAIVVISKNYATSRWCLGELRMIMKLEREKKIGVIPVFYEVNISDVRDHKSRFSLVHHHRDPMIPLWKDALTRIANTQTELKDWYSLFLPFFYCASPLVLGNRSNPLYLIRSTVD